MSNLDTVPQTTHIRVVLGMFASEIEEAERVLGSVNHDARATLTCAWRELHALDGGDFCEGCDAPATTHDADDVPLCAACFKAMLEDAPDTHAAGFQATFGKPPPAPADEVKAVFASSMKELNRQLNRRAGEAAS